MRLAAALEAASAAADRICLPLAKAALAGIALVILLQIALRYGFRAPPAWTEELARYLMVWGGLLGAASAFRRGADPVIVRPRTGGARWAAAARRAAVFAAVLVFLAPVLAYSLAGPGGDLDRGFIARSLARTSNGLGVNMALIGAAIPVSAALILLHAAAQALRPAQPGARP